MVSKEVPGPSEEVSDLPYRYARENHVIAQAVGNHVKVQSISSTPLEVFSELRNFFQKPLEVEWLDSNEFEKELSKFYSDSATSSSELAEGIDDDYDLSILAENLPKTADLLDSDNDAPVIKLINAILSEAIKSSASDIHIEPYEDHLSVRFRIDGILSEILRPTVRITPMLNARIKVMSNLDIAEKRIPQDGRMSLKLGDKWIDIRAVSYTHLTLPTNREV